MSHQGLDFAMPLTAAAKKRQPHAKVGARRLPHWRKVLTGVAIPLTAGAAWAVEVWMPTVGSSPVTHFYRQLLIALGIASVLAAIVAPFWPALRRWVTANVPLIAMATLASAIWNLITQKLQLLPIVYFPGPESVLATLVDNRRELFNSTWHSLGLLMSGYVTGAIAGLISGVIIGWFGKARYWGMPLLKIVGPIPATAWIPLTLVLFSQPILSGVTLIALAVWFPVTMLAASGVSNVRASHLDVARTLGASRSFLIFRVAIPSAMPSIFIGLFMGLGASFLTLLVAESTGIKPGLGWYIDWARNYSDYTKVFAALIIMAVFFSTIMTVLFKLRDRVLVWQKGVIKW